jgi:hypothetical protein
LLTKGRGRAPRKRRGFEIPLVLAAISESEFKIQNDTWFMNLLVSLGFRSSFRADGKI